VREETALKRAACLLAAALLLFALALPAFADETTTAPAPESSVDASEHESFASQPAAQGDVTQAATTATTAAPTMPQTYATETEAVPLSGTPDLDGPVGYIFLGETGALMRNLLFLSGGAAVLAALALLLAVIALAKAGKKPGRNAAGNYQKFF
jgi:hypothetical protein